MRSPEGQEFPNEGCWLEIVPNLAQWERDGEVPRTLHKAAAGAGLLGVAFPEAAGGSGGDIIDVTTVSEEMLYAGASSGLLSALFTHGIALPHLVKSGNTESITVTNSTAGTSQRGD